MSDITLCTTKECPLRHQCLRATAEPNETYQSYSEFGPNKNDDEITCDGFIYYDLT